MSRISSRLRVTRIVVLGVLAVSAAALALAIAARRGLAPLTGQRPSAEVTNGATSAAPLPQVLETPPTPAQAAEFDRLLVKQPDLVQRIPANFVRDSGRLLRRTSRGRMFVGRGAGLVPPGICVFYVPNDPADGGIVNCPSIEGWNAGEVRIPMWDPEGRTVAFVGSTPNGVVAVDGGPGIGRVQAANNSFELPGNPLDTGDLEFIYADGKRTVAKALKGQRPELP